MADSKGVFGTWSRREKVNAFPGSFSASLDADSHTAYRLRFVAKGYQPLETRTFRSDETRVTYDVKMTRAATPMDVTISGVVHQPNGQPVAGADVAITYPQSGLATSIEIENGEIKPGAGQRFVKTGPDGRFSLSRKPDPAGQYFAVIVVHPRFYAEVDRAEFDKSQTIIARPWGRIEGVITARNTPEAGSVVEYIGDRLRNPDVPDIRETGRTTASDTGKFVFDRVIPGTARISGKKKQGSGVQAIRASTVVEVRSGETAQVEAQKPRANRNGQGRAAGRVRRKGRLLGLFPVPDFEVTGRSFLIRRMSWQNTTALPRRGGGVGGPPPKQSNTVVIKFGPTGSNCGQMARSGSRMCRRATIA